MISLLPIGDFKALLQRQAFSWPWSRAKIFSPKQYEKASKAILKAFKGGSLIYPGWIG